MSPTGLKTDSQWFFLLSESEMKGFYWPSEDLKNTSAVLNGVIRKSGDLSRHVHFQILVDYITSSELTAFCPLLIELFTFWMNWIRT